MACCALHNLLLKEQPIQMTNELCGMILNSLHLEDEASDENVENDEPDDTDFVDTSEREKGLRKRRTILDYFGQLP